MSKQSMREETERLVKEALERKAITIKQGKTRIESKCAKCGAPSLSLRRNGFAFTDAADSRNATSHDARA